LRKSLFVASSGGPFVPCFPGEAGSLRLARQFGAHTRYTHRRVITMTDEKDESTERLLREHEAMTRKLASLREQARQLGRGLEEKLKQEILEAEVELTRLSGLLGKIGL
jgi:hypothetical protein